MMKINVWRIIWGPIPASLAGLFLVWQGLPGADRGLDGWIAIAAAFLVVHAIVAYFREQSLPRRVAEQHTRIVRKLMQLLAALGEISGGNHELWKVDVYVVHRSFGVSKEWPWLLSETLRREVQVFLASTAPLPDDPADVWQGPIGICFREMRAVLWTPENQGLDDETNLSANLDADVNDYLGQRFGALRAFPVTDAADHECVGVLLVHVEPAHGMQLAGTLSREGAARRLRETSLDLYGILRSR